MVADLDRNFLNRLIVSSGSQYSLCEGCRHAKQEGEEERTYFYNPSKIFKFMQFILIVVRTSKKH